MVLKVLGLFYIGTRVKLMSCALFTNGSGAGLKSAGVMCVKSST